MLSKLEIIKSIKTVRKPADEDLRKLPFGNAFIYGRVSSPGQVKDSKESIREIARLVKLAKEDGYKTQLDPVQVEAWLNSIAAGVEEKRIMEEGQVTIDVRDLGLSGKLSADARAGMASLQKGILAGKVGGVYVTEGVSRLSRDHDRILPFTLLKQLKESNVRLRTPEGIWNPAIERDWEYLADEFDLAADELKIMNKRLHRRKVQKAARGEFVGEPVPPGFIVPIVGRKTNGQYEFGKLQPYPPHVEINEQILRTLIRSGGSLVKTLKTINGLVYPPFPTELSYMERLSSLRRCRRLPGGYQISPKLILNLATNLKMIGIWQWGECDFIPNNHPPAVPEGLFLEAYQLMASKGKARGRAVSSEPLEWWRLLYCCNHDEPRRLICHHKDGYYSCEKDYIYGKGSCCFFKTAHLLEKPLTQAVLAQLELDPIVEEIISRLESEAANNKISQIRERQQISSAEKELEKWKALLPCCVDETTGTVNREKEKYYWEKIRETSSRLDKIKAEPVIAGNLEPPDYSGLRDFLRSLPAKWESFSRTLRNRFLRSLIDRVELKGDKTLAATIFWKAGFQQQILNQSNQFTRLNQKLWTVDEDELLIELYPSSRKKDILAQLPKRSWKSICLKANRLNLSRRRCFDMDITPRTAPVMRKNPNSHVPQMPQNLTHLQQLPYGRRIRR